MSKTAAIPIPRDSLLAGFGDAGDYRDCFYRDVPGTVSLSQFIEGFYCSATFLPERIILKLIAGPSSRADARAIATGEAESFGAWRVFERRESEALFHSKGSGTASWFAVKPSGDHTRLLFGSWVGGIEQSGWRSLLQAHVWYSRVLLGGVKLGAISGS
ncbi:hypothetical protein [Erythrobacter sp. YT30]|uniref:hypothetical protein n=1 Tax=Erythrobacter sp. YT30 TaxID=1735012 RepID=UPI00076D7610|nr:hypothetical protein [Erythrobacter sp. YT30]KWV91627.1 hypothetical protein AUC45_10430 [Erythrobacter sp. YT30]